MKSNGIKSWSILVLTVLMWQSGRAQNVSALSLDSCLAMAKRNYPQIHQYDLIRQSTTYSLENAQKGKLLQVSIIGQASYQSEVTSPPGGAGTSAPQLSKDQYKLYAEVVQPLTGLAIIDQQKKIIESDAAVSQADLETKLYAIKQRVSDLFFGILLIQGQLRQSELTKADLEAGLAKVEASVKYGTSLKSNADILRAQLITLDQRIIEQEATRESYLKMLGLFVARELDAGTTLISPALPEPNTAINRPELDLFNTKIRSINLQNDLIDKTNRPQFSLFAQSGLGRPALNFLSNDFEPYFIGGLRLSWNLSNLYTSKRRKQILTVNQDILESEKETFLFNTHLNLSAQEIQIEKAQKLIEKDNEIIVLRDRIVETAKGQLANGVITSSEFKTVVIEADEARQHLILHEIELLKLKNDYKLTSGN